MIRKNILKGCMALLAMTLLFAQGAMADEKGNKAEGTKAKSKSVLIVGLNDNVKSNYFYNKMIAEETGISADSVSAIYNRVIAQNIVEAAQKKHLPMTTLTACGGAGDVVDDIRLVGESEDRHSDLSLVPETEWRETLDKAGAEYVLVLNQHYLKWNEEQLRTLFHIVCYSVYDADKNEVYRGNTYFSSMYLITPQEMAKSCKKSTAKIVSNMLKHIEL